MLRTLVVLSILFIPIRALGTPLLYDVTGTKFPDGSIAIGSYVYDPDTNLAWDWNMGAIYQSPPIFTGWGPALTVSPEIGIHISFNVAPINGQIRVHSIIDGVMPLYYLGVDQYVTEPDISWFSDVFAVRVNSAACDGCYWWFPPGPGWYPIIYNLPGYEQPVHAELPEASSLLFMLLGVFIYGLFRQITLNGILTGP